MDDVDLNGGWGRHAIGDKDWNNVEADPSYLTDMHQLATRDAPTRAELCTPLIMQGFLEEIEQTVREKLLPAWATAQHEHRIVAMAMASSALSEVAHIMAAPRGRVAVMRGSYVTARAGALGPACPEWARPVVIPMQHERLFVDGIRMWSCPLTYDHETQLLALSRDETDDLTSGEQRALKELDKLFTREECRVLWMDLFTSKDGRGHRRAFLHQVGRCVRRHKGMIVVDDTLMSVRCGRLFSYLWYEGAFVPDVVLVGKQ